MSRVFACCLLVLGLTAVSAVTKAIEPPDDTAYDTAMNLYRAGDCDAAIPLLASAAASEVRANLPLGQCYFDTASYEEAIKPLSAYLQQFPADDRSVILLARAYEKLNRPEDGINVLNRYISQNPGDLDASVQVGLLYLRAGEREKSAAEFNAILQKAPNYLGALLGLGLVAIEEQRWTDALNYLNQVTQIAPDQVEAYRALGEAYERQQQYEKAASAYDQAFALMPSDFATAKALAKCYAKLGKWGDVARTLRSGSVEEAEDPEATRLVERALVKDTKALEEYCRTVIAQNPKNTAALRVLAEAAYSSKEMDRAKTQYLEILKLERNDPDPEIRFKLGLIFEAEQKFEDARRYYSSVAKSKNAKGQVHLALARVDLALNDGAGAKAALSNLSSADSDSAESKALLAEANVETNDLDGATRLLDDLLAHDPNNKKLLVLAADTAAKQGRLADAVAFLERAVQADAGDKPIRYRLVGIYTNHPELNGHARAMELLKDFALQQEQDPEGYLLLANLYRRNKDVANAKTYFDLGFSKMPNPIPARFAWAYRSYANLFIEQEEWPEALTQQLQAAQLNPNDADGELTLGVIYIKLGKLDDASEVLEKLQTEDPKVAAELEEEARRSHVRLKPQTSQ